MVLPGESGKSGTSGSSFNSNGSLSVGKPPLNSHMITAFDVWMLGIAVVIGGQYFGWNIGLSCGFGSYAIATLLMGSAYSCLILCQSEIASGLPFAGGAYGLARVSLGYYLGFAVGCSEAIEYILYTSASTIALGQMILTVFDVNISFAPIVWLAFYVSATSIHIYGGINFWYFTYFLSIVSILILVMYCLGALAFVDFSQYAGYVAAADDDTVISQSKYFIGGGKGFMTALMNAAWFYVGVESLPFVSDVTIEPKKNMPRGSLSCMTTLAITSILVLFICCSLPAGDSSTATSAFPLNKGFSLMFGLSDSHALILSLPATYATAYGFMLPSGKLLYSLASSKLLPEPLKWTTSFSGTPYVALIFGSILGYLICIVVYFNPILNAYIFNICILSSFLGYISQCIGFIAMQTKFQNIKREFHSPLGISGAVYALLVFGLCVLSVIAFQSDQFALVCVAAIQSVLAAYYFGYAKSHQTFSPEESKVMFVAHVITHNQAGHKHRNKNKNKAYVYSTQNKIVPSSTLGSKLARGDSGLGALSRMVSSVMEGGEKDDEVPPLDANKGGLKLVHVMSKGDVSKNETSITGDSSQTKHLIPIPIHQASKIKQ
jgi:ethanolamine permease